MVGSGEGSPERNQGCGSGVWWGNLYGCPEQTGVVGQLGAQRGPGLLSPTDVEARLMTSRSVKCVRLWQRTWEMPKTSWGCVTHLSPEAKAAVRASAERDHSFVEFLQISPSFSFCGYLLLQSTASKVDCCTAPVSLSFCRLYRMVIFLAVLS